MKLSPFALPFTPVYTPSPVQGPIPYHGTVFHVPLDYSNNIPALLRKMIEVYERPNTWCRGQYAKTTNGLTAQSLKQGSAWCIAGLVALLTGESINSRTAIKVAYALGFMGGSYRGVEQMIAWNDSRHDVAPVLERLRAAADRLETLQWAAVN